MIQIREVVLELWIFKSGNFFLAHPVFLKNSFVFQIRYGCQVSLMALLAIAWVMLHESVKLLLLHFDVNCVCASQGCKPFSMPLPTVTVDCLCLRVISNY